jgi:hypothetical protein
MGDAFLVRGSKKIKIKTTLADMHDRDRNQKTTTAVLGTPLTLAIRSPSILSSHLLRIPSNTPPVSGGASRIMSPSSNGPYSSWRPRIPISLMARSLSTFGPRSRPPSSSPSPPDPFERTTRKQGTLPFPMSDPVTGHVGVATVVGPPVVRWNLTGCRSLIPRT